MNATLMLSNAASGRVRGMLTDPGCIPNLSELEENLKVLSLFLCIISQNCVWSACSHGHMQGFK